VARFAGEHVHKRLISEETYRQKRYDEALKKAFLGTDEDLLAGALHSLTVSEHSINGGSRSITYPRPIRLYCCGRFINS
jgi:hypothetical protein